MAIRKILVPVDGSATSKVALETALAVGGCLAAHVEALHVRVDPRDTLPLVGEGMSGVMIEELIDIAAKEAAHRAARAKATVDEIRTARSIPVMETPSLAGPSVAWIETVGREDEVTVRHGRLADLMVVGRPQAQDGALSSATLIAALFETGRPVLVAPLRERDLISIGRTVAICWNGSAEAARAVSAALPLVSRADVVVVLTAGTEPTGRRAAMEIADYLAWHGVACERRVLTDDKPVGATLLEACADMDMVVMGAYTHSRLRQLILGGVTRHMLEHAELPLFMAH